MRVLVMVMCAALGAGVLVAQGRQTPATDVVKPEMSPILTWDPFTTADRPPTKRPLTPAELARAGTQAEA